MSFFLAEFILFNLAPCKVFWAKCPDIIFYQQIVYPNTFKNYKVGQKIYKVGQVLQSGVKKSQSGA